MAHRYFLSNVIEDMAFIQGEEAKHLSKVMRIKVGTQVIISDKNGLDYNCCVETVTDKEVACKIISKQQNMADAKKSLTVFMALPKSDKLEFVTQKMCELGATDLVPFVSEFCVAQKSKKEDNKKQRLQKISDEACKQSGRSVPMMVQDTVSYKQMVSSFNEFDKVLFLYENGNVPINSVDFEKLEKVAIVIGSEGGFSQNEADLAKENNAEIIGLGNRILRCETAAVTAASIVMYCLGEME